MMKIDLHKAFKSKSNDFELDVQAEFEMAKMHAVFGPSGAGKSTLLRLIAGLEKPDKGFISLNEKTLFDSKKGSFVKAQERGMGFVFQHDNLFPNMSVRDNINYALKKESTRTEELIDKLEIRKLLDQMPDELSGGQRQQVAIARALAYEPKILLLDEALSSLDQERRQYIQGQLIKLQKEKAITIIFVSHDNEEVLTMADKVWYIENGRFSNLDPLNNGIVNSGRIVRIDRSENTVIVSFGGKNIKVKFEKEELDGLNIGQQIALNLKAI